MDMYQSSSGATGRAYSQQRPQHAGGYRFTPNGQLTNGPSLFGNNLNTVFGSGIPPVFSSGNQFNFPLRSNRNGGSNASMHRNNSHLASPNRNSGNNYNQNYGVYSKPTFVSNGTNSGFSQHYNGSGNQGYYQNTTRNGGKQRKGPSQNNAGQSIQSLTASLVDASLEESQFYGASTSPDPQYRILKRGDSYGAAGGSETECSNGEASNVKTDASQKANGNPSGSEIETQSSSTGDNALDSASGNSHSTRTDPSGNKHQYPPNLRTPISLVAEVARFNGMTSEYRLVSEVGPPHCPTFTVVLQLGTETHEGTGPSIKKAQLAAATEALGKSSLPKPPARPNPPRKNNKPLWHSNVKASNSQLQQLSALAEEINQPLHFVNHPITLVDPMRKVTPCCRVAAHIGDRIFTGEGDSFNAAKSIAVMVALKALLKMKSGREKSEVEGSGAVPRENENEYEIKSPISVVYEMAYKRNMGINYEIVKEAGPAHMKVFTVQCRAGDAFTTESDGFTKQQAKKLASELMIKQLKEIPVPGESSFKALNRAFLKPKTKRKAGAPVLKDVEKASVSPISRLIQIAHLRKYKEPEFSVLSSQGTSEGGETRVEPQVDFSLRGNKRNVRVKKPHFIIEVRVGPYVCRGEGPNKKAAKKSAADNALVLLGYSSSETMQPSKPESQSPTMTSSSSEVPSTSKSTPNILKIVSGRQIVPGILVIRNDTPSNTTVQPQSQPEKIHPIETAEAEPPKPFPLKAPSNPTIVHEAVNKLSYLAQLLGVQVSYSDFPKKNEYLSVVSLGTDPPHVSHGIGPTMEAARNNAAMKVLTELSDKGLENEPMTSGSPESNSKFPDDSQSKSGDPET